MTENEVKEVQQPEVEDIEVEVTENEAQVETTEASNDDELEKYTKGVSKHISSSSIEVKWFLFLLTLVFQNLYFSLFSNILLKL